jgi:hypothetical protein
MSKIIMYLQVAVIWHSGYDYFSNYAASTTIKIFNFDQQDIRVTTDVDDIFFGLYKGDKSGYLLLNPDGTGEYKYDIFGVAPEGCQEEVIQMEWGFPLDEMDQIVRFKKPYGYSHPVIFKCSGEVCFQGCSKVYILDFILDKNDGKLHVSSSDDWEKVK